MALRKLKNEIQVWAIDQNGKKVGTEPMTLRNVPIEELWPGEPVCIIDWLAASDTRPEAADLRVPIPFDGHFFFGDKAWGSAVKRCMTIGLTHDLLVECGLLTEVERTIKTGRALLSQGLFGGLVGDMKVKVLKDGTHIGPHRISDGQGVIRKSVAELGYNRNRKINLGGATGGRQSYQFWQRVPWTEPVACELRPVIKSTLEELANSAVWLMEHKDSTWDFRKSLVELEPKMIEHPYVANALSRTVADDLFRAATTVDLPCAVRVLIASDAVKTAAVLWDSVIARYPIQSNGSMPTVTGGDDAQKAEAERVSKLEVIQYTITSKEEMANGTLIVVDDDEMPDGVDIVICRKDIKMGSDRLGERTIDGVINFTQWFAAGCALAVNPEWALTMGADYDGDLAFVYDMTEYPHTWWAIRKLPPQDSGKLKKTHTLIGNEDARAEMAANSMCNIVGFATNVMSTTHSVADRRALAKQLGFASLERMDWILNELIEIGTDGFKTRAWDRKKVERKLVFFQKGIRQILGKMAPWTSWRRSTWAFRRGIPGFWRKDMTQVEQANCVQKMLDGTIAQICKLTLPVLGKILEAPIMQRPLSNYRDWAPLVSARVMDEAHSLQQVYNGRVHRVNWTDPQSAGEFRTWWQDALSEWVDKGGHSKEVAAFALWREAHSSRSDQVSGASVFIGFPEEVINIITNKPGRKSAQEEVKLVGLNYVLSPVPNPLVCEVEVREFVQVKKKVKLTRKIVCTTAIPNKAKPKGAYPADMLGMVEIHGLQPECGRYQATIVEAGHGKAWHAKLVALDA